MRKREKMDAFSFPDVPDVASVGLEDIKVLFTNPKSCWTTKKQLSYIKFDYNFSDIIVK